MSTKERMEETIIEIEGISNVKYEEPRNFKSSVSYRAYKRAFDITQEIIEDNRNYKSSVPGRSTGTDLRNKEQICNIIFFTGDRGTGKTSVMLSYMEFLKDYYRNYKKNCLPEDMIFSSERLMFTGLEHFDASSLNNKKEDILGSVLAKMLKKWDAEEKRSYGNHGIRKEEDYAYKKRQTQRHFNQVYKYLKNIRSKDDIMDEDSDLFIETLENMSMTWNLKQAFQELVAEYLSIMEYPESENDIGRDNHFLVISIDDLDLNIENGFSLLDEVRKYLMIPNIIVLLSANNEQLEKVCINHYVSEFKDTKNILNLEKHIKKLAREYMEKIMPVPRQIPLYSGDKWDFFRERAMSLKYGKDESGEPREYTGTIEGFVINNMNKYLNIEMSSDRKILYYLTPDTLRELSSWVGQITSLRDIQGMDGKSEEHMYIYNENLKWFWNEQFPWLIKKYLDPEEQEIFESMEMLSPASQMHFLKSLLEEKYKGSLKRSLLQILSRLGKNSIKEQSLSAMCLLYFTIKLSEIITLISYSTGKVRDNNLQLFMRYYDNGVWGVWEKDMINALVKTFPGENTFNKIGYIFFAKSNACLTVEIKGLNKTNKPIDILLFIENHKEYFINYQYLLLFYRFDINNASSESPVWTLKWTTKENFDIVKISLIKNYSGQFCLSNIVLSILEGARLVKCFLNDLDNSIKRELGIKKGDKEEEDKIKTVIDKISILNSISIMQKDKVVKIGNKMVKVGNGTIKEGIKKYLGEFLMPLGDLEYLISLGTQIQSEMGYGAPDELNELMITNKIVKFFTIIQESLLEYKNANGEIKEYANKFMECPPIKKILENDKNFMNMLITSISGHTEKYQPSTDEEEWGLNG